MQQLSFFRVGTGGALLLTVFFVLAYFSMSIAEQVKPAEKKSVTPRFSIEDSDNIPPGQLNQIIKKLENLQKKEKSEKVKSLIAEHSTQKKNLEQKLQTLMEPLKKSKFKLV